MASFLALDIVEFPKDPKTGQTILHLRWVAQYVCKSIRLLSAS